MLVKLPVPDLYKQKSVRMTTVRFYYTNCNSKLLLSCENLAAELKFTIHCYFSKEFDVVFGKN